MPRLSLSSTVVKRLFAYSGNECAYPDCNLPMANDKTILGEICHIEAAEKGGQRFNDNSNDKYRRSSDNLILMCGHHHKVTNDIDIYTVEKLREIKKAHESRFSSGPELKVTDAVIKTAQQYYLLQQNTNTGSGGQINNQAQNQTIGNQIGTVNYTNNYIQPAQNLPQNKPYKLLDADFWNKAGNHAAESEAFLLGLHSEEKILCGAIVSGLVCNVDYYFVNEEERINNLEWEISNTFDLRENKLLLFVSASGAGKTSLMHILAYSLYESHLIIKLIRPIKSPLEKIADYGIILLDEITGHQPFLSNYQEYFQTAFPLGFVFIIAEQQLVWDLFEQEHRIIKQYDSVNFVGIKPVQSTLHDLYTKIENIVKNANDPLVLDALTQNKRKFLAIKEGDYQTIADRLIDLYYDAGLQKTMLKYKVRPDWEVISSLGDPRLDELYNFTAFASESQEDFDIKLLGDQKQLFSGALKIVSKRNEGSYPLQFVENATQVKLRHYRIARWYYKENPGLKALAESFYYDLFNEKFYSPEKIKLLRKFYQKRHGELLRILGWTESSYYECLMAYYELNKMNDFELQGLKSFYEGLKILYNLDREAYEKKILDKMASVEGDEKGWLYSCIIKNLLKSNHISEALQRIEECKHEPWFVTSIQSHMETAHLRAVEKWLYEKGQLPEGITTSYTLNTILDIAKNVVKRDEKSLRLKGIELYAYYINQKNLYLHHEDTAEEWVLITYCKLLISEGKYKELIEVIGKCDYGKNPSLAALLGFALLNHPDPKYGTPKELIYNSFCQNPTINHTLIYLNILLNKERIIFSDEELKTLQEKMESLQLIRSNPLISKCLSDISRKLNDLSGAELILRTALNKYPNNDHLKIELGVLLLGIYQRNADPLILKEIETVTDSCYNKETGYFKIFQIKFYHTTGDNEAAIQLSRELVSDKEFETTGNFLLVKSIYLVKKYQSCIEEVIKLYFDKKIYYDFEINNCFYFSFLQLSKSSDEHFKSNFIKYRYYIHKLYDVAGLETNDYFKYISFIVHRDYDIPERKQAIIPIRAAIAKDSEAMLNLSLLKLSISFFFTTEHYNSITQLINFIRKSPNAVNLTPLLIFDYRACGIIFNNRIFIEYPAWESRSDNLVVFPQNIEREDLLQLTHTYLKVFQKLGYLRRRVIFCFCLIKNYPNEQSLIAELKETIKNDIIKIFRCPFVRPDLISERGKIHRVNQHVFEIRNAKGSVSFSPKKNAVPLKIGGETENWSYFSITNNSKAYNVEPGFVIDGYTQTELLENKDGISEPRKPQGIYFQAWARRKGYIL